MFIINSLKTKFTQYNLFFPTILVGLLIILSPTLFSYPFGDDFVYIFNNSHITQTNNPFIFWNMNSESYKSWPITYSLFWIMFKLFGTNYFLYRIINIILHFFTGYIFYKILHQYNLKFKKLIVLLFLFNPISIESIFWIFQLKTILSTLLIFLSLFFWNKFRKHKSIKFYFLILLFFILSLLTKSVAIFIPFVFIITKSSFREKLLFIPFFIISIYCGLESIKGITNSISQQVKIETYQDRYFQQPSQYEQKVKVIEYKRAKEFHQKSNVEKLSIVKESYLSIISRNFKLYFNKILDPNILLTKSIIISSSFIFYLKSTFGLSSYLFVYDNFNFFDNINYLYIVLFITLLSLILRSSKESRELFLISLLLFLPISGLFYVPYMEFSYVADHWFYSSYGFILILFIKLIQKLSNNRIQDLVIKLFTLFLVFQFTLVSYGLRSTKGYFYKNLEVVPNSTILYEYLIELEKKDNNSLQAIKLSEELLKFTDNKLPVIDTIKNLAEKTNNIDLLRKYTLIKSKSAFRLGNISLANSSLNEFNFESTDKDYIFYKSIYSLITKKSLTEKEKLLIKNFLIN